MGAEHFIENMYVAFADAPKPPKVLGCPCEFCISTEGCDVLLKQELRETDIKLIRVLSETIMVTVGDENAFHYFLPRFLHLEFIEPGFIEMPDAFLKNLATARIELWPSHHREIIHKALELKLDLLCKERDEDDLDEWLCGICHLPFEIAPFLEVLDKTQHSETKTELLKLFVRNKMSDQIRGEGWNSVRDVSRKSVFEWATNDENIQTLIENGYWVR